MPYQEPEFLPWDGRRVPITFVGGCLGAGKTTATNDVLADDPRCVALVQVVGSRVEVTPLFDNEQRPPTDLVVITVEPDT